MIKFSGEIVLALKVWGLMMAMIKFSKEIVLALKVWGPAVILSYQWTILIKGAGCSRSQTLNYMES